MNDTRRFALLAVTAMLVVVLPCTAQEQQNGQATPAVTGAGSPGHIAVWKSSSALTSSVISQSSGNVGIGTTAPVTKLEVNGNAQVDGSLLLGGNIILSVVDGPLFWATISGNSNFSAGIDAMMPTTSGMVDTAVGNAALYFNTSGSDDTAVGHAALFSNTSGGANTAVGSGSLGGNTSGEQNTAVGATALYNNILGSANTAIGFDALFGNTGEIEFTGSANTAVGADSLEKNTLGNSNTAIGWGSLFNNTTGNNNTALGVNALVGNVTGSFNIAIGYNAGLATTSTSNNIDIGSSGNSADNGTMRIGTQGTQTTTYIAGISGVNISGVPVLVSPTGQLGVASSSRRYKEDINDMADSSDGLMQLRPVTFKYRKAYEDGSKPIQYGLIAEEVAEVYPDLVARSADGQVETVRYQLLDPMLLNELQKQHATIDAQKKQIQSLEERLARIEAMLAAGATVATGQ